MGRGFAQVHSVKTVLDSSKHEKIIADKLHISATVRAVSHVSALTVMSTTHVPGEAPKVVGIRDQRLTAFSVSVLLGVSVLLAPILKLVPFAVLFGVFLYMGVSGMNGVQFFDRVSLCFMPVKHHPTVSYVQNVKTWR